MASGSPAGTAPARRKLARQGQAPGITPHVSGVIVGLILLMENGLVKRSIVAVVLLGVALGVCSCTSSKVGPSSHRGADSPADAARGYVLGRKGMYCPDGRNGPVTAAIPQRGDRLVITTKRTSLGWQVRVHITPRTGALETLPVVEEGGRYFVCYRN